MEVVCRIPGTLPKREGPHFPPFLSLPPWNAAVMGGSLAAPQDHEVNLENGSHWVKVAEETVKVWVPDDVLVLPHQL